jgi:hypothetical protein
MMETTFLTVSLIGVYVILTSYFLFFRKNEGGRGESITSKTIKEDSEIMVLARPTIINFVIGKEEEAICTSELMADFTINFNEILDGSYLKKESFQKLKKRFDYSSEYSKEAKEAPKIDDTPPKAAKEEPEAPKRKEEGEPVVYSSDAIGVYSGYEVDVPDNPEDSKEDPLNYVTVEF